MILDALREHRFEPRRCTYTENETILYALSVGAGAAALDERELSLVYERHLWALPTMAAVLGHPGPWLMEPKFSVQFDKLLHGEQRLTVLHPLPTQGEIEATYRVLAVVDKGEGKGALLYFEKRLSHVQTGRQLATVLSTYFLRGDGGCGSLGSSPEALPETPTANLQIIGELVVDPRAALLYRLNGDRNALHIDPAVAASAGFERPLLHGLCTYGIAGYLLVRHVCDYEVARLRSLSVRFTSPVYPGETVRLEGSRCDQVVYFQARVLERDRLVLGQGFAQLG